MFIQTQMIQGTSTNLSTTLQCSHNFAKKKKRKTKLDHKQMTNIKIYNVQFHYNREKLNGARYKYTSEQVFI